MGEKMGDLRRCQALPGEVVLFPGSFFVKASCF